MKKNFQTIVMSVTCLAVVICLFKINGLENQIRNLNSSLNNQISSVNSSVNSIYSNVSGMLEEMSSLIVAKSYDYKDFDSENGLAEISVNIVPKEFSADKTKAYVYIDDNRHEMKFENGNYTLDVKIPIFDNTVVSKIELIENGIVRNEIIDWYLTPADEFLPWIDAYIINGTWNHNKGYSMKGTINVDINASSVALPEITGTYIIETIDGKIENRESIDMDFKYNDEYYAYGRYDISRNLEIPAGSVYNMYLAMEDENGFVYVNELDGYELDSNGEPASSMEAVARTADIYNREGKLLCKRN